MKNKYYLIIALVVCLLLCSCGRGNASIGPADTPNSVDPSYNTPTESVTIATEELVSGPPESDYTEIVLQDDQYYLCKKIQSGFTDNSEYYGIYDAQNNTWALQYAGYETYDIPSMIFNSHGNGMFSYKYSSYYGTMMFLSAELESSFQTEKIYNYESVKFIDGRAIALIHEEPSQTYVDGMIAPTSRLVWIDTYGNISSVSIPGFDSDDLLYWSESVLTGYSDQDEIYANSFYNYNTGERLHYVFIYHYEDGSCTLISDQDYIGDSPSSSNITVEGDIIRIDQLEGDDGELYYAEFDRDGNVVTPATLMN